MAFRPLPHKGSSIPVAGCARELPPLMRPPAPRTLGVCACSSVVDPASSQSPSSEPTGEAPRRSFWDVCAMMSTRRRAACPRLIAPHFRANTSPAEPVCCTLAPRPHATLRLHPPLLSPSIKQPHHTATSRFLRHMVAREQHGEQRRSGRDFSTATAAVYESSCVQNDETVANAHSLRLRVSRDESVRASAALFAA